MSIRDDFGRSVGGRGRSLTMRGKFAKVASSPLPLSTQAKVLRSADMVVARVNKHHEKHRERWTEKRYKELLANSPNSRTLTPMGSQADPKERFMAQAKSEVSARRNHRIERVERAQASMLSSGKVRGSRKMNWGKGLGE